MKKLFILLLIVVGVFAASLFAQVELTFVGGMNLGSVTFNENEVDNYYDISMKPGLILGVETIGGPFIIGGVFIQRGVIIELSEDFGEFKIELNNIDLGTQSDTNVSICSLRTLNV